MSTTPAAAPAFSKGLAGVVAAQTGLSSVDGTNGVLTYRGINIHDLAGKASYEEIVYLLWHGKLPNRAELAAFQKQLAANRSLPPAVSDHIAGSPAGATPMDVLRTAVSALAYYDSEVEDISIEATQRKGLRLLAQFPAVVAGIHRHREGKAAVHYTQKKFVSKPPRSKPGLVRLSSFKTILVEPRCTLERLD